ncbi:MAG TPA: zf-HC2 domain-containing protein [Gaiellaceae bacterium]
MPLLLHDLVDPDCARSRELVSRDLDGELSEHERAGLRTHLAACASCASFAAATSGITAVLRQTPLDDVSVTVVPVRRRSRGMSLAVKVGVAAAAVAAAFAMGSAIGSHRSNEILVLAPTGNNAAELRNEYLEPHLLAMLAREKRDAHGRVIPV